MTTSVTFQVPGARLPAHLQRHPSSELPPLVFLHAGVCDHRLWLAQLEAFAAERTVLAYDRRGYGGVEIEQAAPFSHLADLWAVMDAAGLSRAVLVGCSLGGRLALEAALDRPERVAALFLVAPAVNGVPAPELNAQEQAMDAAADAAYEAGDLAAANEALAALWLDGPSSPAGRVSGAARALFLDMDDRMLRATPPGTALEAEPSWPRLEQISAPTELLWGDLDLGYFFPRCEAMVARIPGARGTVMPGVAHLPSLEAPEAFNTALAAFLAGLPG